MRGSRSCWQARSRMRLPEGELQESFIGGGRGAGGTALNKTRNTVQLTHVPTGVVVKCKAGRSQDLNRREARKILSDRVEHLLDPVNSRLAERERKERKRNAKRRSRALKKHAKPAADDDAECVVHAHQ